MSCGDVLFCVPFCALTGDGMGVADTLEAAAGSLSALGKILAIWLCKKLLVVTFDADNDVKTLTLGG